MQNNKNPKRKRVDIGAYILTAILLIALIIAFVNLSKPTAETVTYNDIVSWVKEDSTSKADVTNVTAKQETTNLFTVSGYYTTTDSQGKKVTTQFTCVLTESNISSLENDYSIAITKELPDDNTWLSIILNLLPIIIIVLFYFWIMKSNGNGKAMEFGKSTARLARGKTVTFNDVAGCDEEKQE